MTLIQDLITPKIVTTIVIISTVEITVKAKAEMVINIIKEVVVEKEKDKKANIEGVIKTKEKIGVIQK